MRRVLIADDDPDCRYLLETVLESVYEVRTVSDGPSAMAVLGTWEADVVILDINLPGGPGTAIAAEIRRRCSARILAYTGSAELTREALGLFDEFVLKPARPSAVLSVVNQLVA